MRHLDDAMSAYMRVKKAREEEARVKERKEPEYGYTEVFQDGWMGDYRNHYFVNRKDHYRGDSGTVVCCPTKEAAEAARRLLAGK